MTVFIANSGETGRCRTDESLLEGLRRLGKRGVPVGCRGGGCSVCKVEVVSGRYARFRPMSREYVNDRDLAEGRVLACCIRPVSALEVRAIGRMGDRLAATDKTTTGATRLIAEER
ncbi:2Fe-2S iron-sulfur cluster binding domain-containing protein [Roseiarcus fermentans]|uniref:2Fe-2S iron-sulfur cluster binding domain-containing protein n=1 Tax=Roseiarcus fermentans TaxID=1473586 RepID=UPI001AED0C38|nr:2Fe-2S iron-sulfur cluster binding domain-containing protein [Roseiarcus fermentans]